MAAADGIGKREEKDFLRGGEKTFCPALFFRAFQPSNANRRREINLSSAGFSSPTVVVVEKKGISCSMKVFFGPRNGLYFHCLPRIFEPARPKNKRDARVFPIKKR